MRNLVNSIGYNRVAMFARLPKKRGHALPYKACLLRADWRKPDLSRLPFLFLFTFLSPAHTVVDGSKVCMSRVFGGWFIVLLYFFALCIILPFSSLRSLPSRHSHSHSHSHSSDPGSLQQVGSSPPHHNGACLAFLSRERRRFSPFFLCRLTRVEL